MGFGCGKGEHASKVPERIPTDAFQQTVLQDAECSAVKRPVDFQQVVPSFWKLENTEKEEFLP